MENGINNLPSEVSVWSKIRGFLCQNVEITLTPKQEKAFNDISNFWNQEITGQDVHDFLFYNITGSDVKNFVFKKIEITDNITL